MLRIGSVRSGDGISCLTLFRIEAQKSTVTHLRLQFTEIWPEYNMIL